MIVKYIEKDGCLHKVRFQTNAVETLVIIQALRLIADDPETNPVTQVTAVEMLRTIERGKDGSQKSR